MSKNFKIALCGVVSALCVAIMAFSSIIPFSTYYIPMIAGAVVVAIVIEVDKRYAFFVYVTVSVLSAILIPNKEATVMYILFMGYYPILKGVFEGRLKLLAEWVLKLLTFNISMILIFLIGIHILGIPKEEYTIGGIYLPWVFLLFGNVMFLLYDLMLSQLVKFYIIKIQPQLKKLIKH